MCKKRQTGQVVVCFFGDGASNIGFFHEGLNFASIHELPVVFICENNQYALSMKQEKSMAVKDIADRAASYNMPGVVVPGNDVIAVYEETRKAINRTREGKGPILVECKTYRLLGHHHGDPGCGIKYRTKEEMAAWEKKDPIKRFKKRLMDGDIVSDSDIDKIENNIANQIEEAVAYAKASPFPEPEEALTDLFAH
ncbi:thiamine pyrophosphate-dependent enzyme [bacterium]|nr:thiamine pyrophosphate-dependent enzyme [bacterium]